MDQSLLVKAGHTIVAALDQTNLKTRAAMWVHNTDTDTCKLWLVPATPVKDQRDFYRQLSVIATKNRNELGDVDDADVELVGEDHPAIKGLKAFLKMPGLGSAQFTGNARGDRRWRTTPLMRKPSRSTPRGACSWTENLPIGPIREGWRRRSRRRSAT